MIYFPETELYARIAAEHGGREPTRKERLQHAMHMGHVAEAAFKALARALREAWSIDPRRGAQVASTKGSL